MKLKGKPLMRKHSLYNTFHKFLSILLVTIMLANMALPVLADGPIEIFLPLIVKEGESENNGTVDLQPPLLNSLLPYSPAPVTPSEFQMVPSDAGTTIGGFQVSHTGAGQYTIKIDVPPGTAGLMPNLELTYDGQGGNSVVGVGWSLGGLSTISRCPTTLAQHGFIDGVDFDDNDQFCLDGQYLMAVAGDYGADQTRYRTESETFSEIISYGTAGNGPERFLVRTKSGLVMEYAFTADARIEAQGRADVFAWAVNKISDTKGNYLTVSYAEDNSLGEYYPTRIDYTGNEAAGLTPYNAVVFDYEIRPDVSTGYVGGSKITLRQRLTAVKTLAEGQPVREYRLGYEIGSTTQRSRLASVTECHGSGDCFTPTTFTWQEGEHRFIDSGAWLTDAYADWKDTPQRIFSMDVNGDGLMDIVLGPSDQGQWFVLLSTGTGFVDAGAWISSAYASWTDVPERIRPMDVNGDGLMDMVLGPNGRGEWFVLLSDGTRFVDGGLWISNAYAGWTDVLERIRPMDVDVDGRMDIVLGPNGRGEWFALLSDGARFVDGECGLRMLTPAGPMSPNASGLWMPMATAWWI